MREAVIDGFIAQDSFKIAVETKLTPEFDLLQLERHLQIFTREDHRLLLLLAPAQPAITAELKAFCDRAQTRRISVLSTTFERIIEVMRSVLSANDEEMHALLADFEDFCDDSEHRLLPNDRFMMFTPPCGPSHIENDRLRLYYCPAERPLRRAQYIGIYANKAVGAIGKIAKVLSCDIDFGSSQVTAHEGTSLTREEELRILEAAKLAEDHGWNVTTGHRFYLCDEWHPTSYRKVSAGGIMGSRMIDLRRAFPQGVPATISQIASGLTQITWT